MTNGEQSTERSAYDEALRCLGRRAYGRSELLQRLVRRGHDPGAADCAVRRLLDAGLVDDEALALEFILARARKGHAPGRAVRELRARGIDAATARRASERARVEHGLETRALLEEQVRRRLGAGTGRPPLRELRRVYNALLRAGFEAPDVREALGPYLSSHDLLDLRGQDESGPEDDWQ